MKFRRLLTGTCIGTCIVLGGLALTPVTSGAAPTNSKTSEIVTAHCGADGNIDLVINSGAPAFDVAVSNGRTYVLRSVEGRDYLGSPATEPDPATSVFTSAKDYGNRNGFSRTLTCTVRLEFSWDGVGYTAFIDAVLAAK